MHVDRVQPNLTNLAIPFYSLSIDTGNCPPSIAYFLFAYLRQSILLLNDHPRALIPGRNSLE